MVESNRILYNENEHPDHVVVIKYAPYVGMFILQIEKLLNLHFNTNPNVQVIVREQWMSIPVKL